MAWLTELEAEEIHNAAVIVPWSMVTTIMLNGVLGFAMLIAVLFCLGNVQNAMNTPTNYPFIEIFQQATNSLSGATAMTAVLVALDIFAAVGILATSSRMLWAFARDNGLPGSKYLTRVGPEPVGIQWLLTHPGRTPYAAAALLDRGLGDHQPFACSH
jgi:amino acid transporter